jgi:hypothetical protein
MRNQEEKVEIKNKQNGKYGGDNSYINIEASGFI